MMVSVEKPPDVSADAQTFTKDFYEALSSKDQKRFDDAYDTFDRQYPNLSMVEKCLMTCAWLIQVRLMGKSWESIMDDQDELSKREQELLSWSRKLLNKNVVDVVREEQQSGRERTFKQVLEEHQSKYNSPRDDELEFEDDTGISMDDVDIDRDAFDDRADDEAEVEFDDEFEDEADDGGGSVDSGGGGDPEPGVAL